MKKEKLDKVMLALETPLHYFPRPRKCFSALLGLIFTALSLLQLQAYNNLEFDLGRDTILCQGSQLLLDAGLKGDTLSFLWNTGDTTSTLMVTESGTWSLLVSSPNCQSIDSIIVRFIPLPEVDLVIDEVCFGEPSTIVNNSQYIESAIFRWDFGDGTTSTSKADTLQHQFNQSNTEYEVKLIIDHGAECISEGMAIARIKVQPMIRFQADDNCLGDSTILVNNSEQLLAEASLFINTEHTSGEFSSSLDTLKLHFQSPGLISIRIRADNNNGCTATDTLILEVFPLPTVDLGQDTSLLSGESIQLKNFLEEPNVSYNWSNGSTMPTLEVFNPGYYFLQVTNQDNGCSFSDTLFVDLVSSATGENALSDVIQLYPNPSYDHVYIELGLDNALLANPIELVVYDLLGRLLLKRVLFAVATEKDQTTFKLETSQFAPGKYYLVINSRFVKLLLVSR